MDGRRGSERRVGAAGAAARLALVVSRPVPPHARQPLGPGHHPRQPPVVRVHQQGFAHTPRALAEGGAGRGAPARRCLHDHGEAVHGLRAEGPREVGHDGNADARHAQGRGGRAPAPAPRVPTPGAVRVLASAVDAGHPAAARRRRRKGRRRRQRKGQGKTRQTEKQAPRRRRIRIRPRERRCRGGGERDEGPRRRTRRRGGSRRGSRPPRLAPPPRRDPNPKVGHKTPAAGARG